MGWRTVALLLLLALPLPALAARDSIDNHLRVIKQLLISTRYEEALAQVKVARQERHGTDEDVTLWLYEGILLFELRQEEEGTAAFRRGLLLRPEAKLPVPVSPKIQKAVDSVRQEVIRQRDAARQDVARREEVVKPPSEPKPKPELIPPTVSKTEAPPALGVRRHAWIPAVTGGALAVAGGVSWGISRERLKQLNDPNSSITSRAEAERIAASGKAWQATGVGLLSAGAAGLVTAAGMYLLGAPPDRPTPSIGVSTNGTSALLYGRWP